MKTIWLLQTVCLVFFMPCIYSNDDPCLIHTVLDASTRLHSLTSNNNTCDNSIDIGWYKFMAGNQPTKIPTKCLQNNVCGTQLPMRIDLGGGALPTIGSTIQAHACTSYNVLGQWDCCVLRQSVQIKNCSDFYVYHLQPTDRCPVAYCADDPLQEEYQNIVVKHGEVAPPTANLPSPLLQESTTQANNTTETQSTVTLAFPFMSVSENNAESTTESSETTASTVTTNSGTSLIPSMTSSRHDETTEIGVNATESIFSHTFPNDDVSTRSDVGKPSTNETNVPSNTTVTMETIIDNVTNSIDGNSNTSDYNMATGTTPNLVNVTGTTTILQYNTTDNASTTPDQMNPITTTEVSPISNSTTEYYNTSHTEPVPSTNINENQTVSNITSPERSTINDTAAYQTTTETLMINQLSTSLPDEQSTLDDVDHQTNANNVTLVQSTPRGNTSLDASTEGQAVVDNTLSEDQTTFNTTTPEVISANQTTTDQTITTPSIDKQTVPNTAQVNGTTADIMIDTRSGEATTAEATFVETTTSSNDTMSITPASELSEETHGPSTLSLDAQTSPSLVTQTSNINDNQTVGTTSRLTTEISSVTTIRTPDGVSTVDYSFLIETTVEPDVVTTLQSRTSERQQDGTTMYLVTEPTSSSQDITTLEVTNIAETSSLPSVTQDSQVVETTTILSRSSARGSPSSAHPEITTSQEETIPVRITTSTSSGTLSSLTDEIVATTSTPSLPDELGSTRSSQDVVTTSGSITTVSLKPDQDTNISPLPETTSVVQLTSSSMSTLQTSTNATLETTQLVTESSNATDTSGIPISDVEHIVDDKKGLIHDNFGLFIFIVVASSCIVAIFLFGIIGHMYRLRRLRTWTPRMAYQDAYSDMEKKTLAFRSDYSGVESPIPDIDIMHEEMAKEEETSLSQASTLALGPTPGHQNLTNGHQDMTSPRSVNYDESYIEPGVGETNEGFVDDNVDGVVPYEELDNEYPRAFIPWIENAEDTKL